jgi:hypothetical protein
MTTTEENKRELARKLEETFTNAGMVPQQQAQGLIGIPIWAMLASHLVDMVEQIVAEKIAEAAKK